MLLRPWAFSNPILHRQGPRGSMSFGSEVQRPEWCPDNRKLRSKSEDKGGDCAREIPVLVGIADWIAHDPGFVQHVVARLVTFDSTKSTRQLCEVTYAAHSPLQ
jgi:hypothetical protein